MDISALKATLAQQPWNIDAAEKLQAALADAGDLAGLSELHRQLADAYTGQVDPEPFLRSADLRARTCNNEAVATLLYGHLGLFYWRKLDNSDKAELYFRRLEGHTAGFEQEYNDFYLEFYAKRGNWRRLEQFAMEQANNPQNPDDIVPVKRKLAVMAAKSDKPDKAIAFWSDVRALRPSDEEAEAALTSLYIEVKKWHSLIELLQDKLKSKADSDVAGKIAIYNQMIEIFRDHIKSETKVSATYQSILELDPGNSLALDALVEQYNSMKRWPDLVRVLQQKIGHTKDKVDLIKLHRQVAQIMMERFSNSAEALKSYSAILELDPENREAIEQLKDIYEKRRDYENYLEIARREVALEANEEHRRTKFLELARFAADKIRRPSAAIGLWEDMLALDPHHKEALENLESLYEREKSYGKLVEILEKRIEITQNPSERVAMLEKLGLVISARLEDEARATQVWKRILEDQPEHRKAQNELRKHYLAARDWDGLEWFYRRYGTVAELVRTLDAQIKTLEKPDDQIGLLFKSAELLIHEQQQPQKAIKTLEQALAIDPQNGEVARRLAPLYRNEADWSKLADVLEIQLADEADAVSRQNLLLELARLYEDSLSDPEKALFSYVQVYKENFDDESSRRELERLCALSDNWDTYVAVLEDTIPRISDTNVKLEAQLRAAEVYRDYIGDLDQSLRHFQMSIVLDPENHRAMDAIEGLYVEMEDWRLLVEVYKRKRQLAQHEDEERDVLFKLGAVWRDKLGNNEEAARVLQELLARFPDDARVHRELSALYLIEEDYDGLLSVLNKELELLNSDITAPPQDLAAVHIQIAQLTYAIGGNLETVVHHLSEALESDPDSDEARTSLEELISATDIQRQITNILGPVYRRRGDWERLSDVYELQVGYCTDASDKIGLLQGLGELYRDRLADEIRAFRSHARIFLIDPSSTGVREQLEDLAGRVENWYPLIELYESKVDDISDPTLQREVRLTIASTYREKLQVLENAQLHYELALEADPTDSGALDPLEQIYGQTAQWQNLLSVYRRKVDLASEFEQRIDYLFRIEQIWSNQLNNLDEAIATANEILDIDRDRIAAHRRLEYLYSQGSRWPELAATLQELERLATNDVERVELLGRLAATREHRLDDVTGAVDIHAVILGIDPDNSPTVAALERLFAARTQSVAVAALLEPYYRRHDEWLKLVDIYEVQKEASGDPQSRVALDFRIAELYESKGGDPESAFLYYGSAYQTLPEHDDTLVELLRLADVLRNHSDLVALLAGFVDSVTDSQKQREIHRIIAEVADQKSVSAQLAIKHYRAVLELEPGDMPAIDALLRLYRNGREWPQLVEILRKKASLVLNFGEKSELLKEAGRISAAELDQPEQAIELYDSVLELHPDDEGVLDALESLYARVENWDRLVAILARKIDLATDYETKKSLAIQRAEVFELQLDALDEAVDSYRMVLEWKGDDLDALRGLDALFTQKSDWLDLLDILKRMQPLVSATEWADIQFRIGQIWENQLNDNYQAVDAYRLLLANQVDDERAINALENVVLNKDEREAAFDVLVPVLEVTDQYQRLYDLHAFLVEHRDDSIGKIKLLRRMGELAEHQLNDKKLAFDGYAQAFREDPNDVGPAAELERLAAENGFYEELQTLLTAAAEKVGDPVRELELRLRTAAILKDNLGDAPRAIERYEALYADHSHHVVVLQALDELYQLSESWPKLTGILRAEIEQTNNVDEKVSLYFRLAQVAEDHLNNPTTAFESYRETLYLSPGNDDAISELWRLCEAGHHRAEIAEILEPVYLDRKAWKSLHSLYEIRLEETTDPLDKGDLMRRLADLNLDKLDEPIEAIRWYGEAFCLDPQDDFVLAKLEELAELTDEWSHFASILLRAADLTQDVDRRISLWHRAVVLYREKLSAETEAELLLLQILELDEENRPALIALDEIYTSGNSYESLEPILRREIAGAEYDDDRVRLLARLGALHRDKLGNRVEAIAAFRAILDINDSDMAALRALADIYESGEDDWEPLFGIYRQLSALVPSVEERIDLFERMALVAESRLDKPNEAAELWEEILLLDSTRRSALSELQRILQNLGKNDALADALDRELSLLSDSETERRQTLHRQLGRLWRDVLSDPLQAQHHWEQTLALAPEDQEALISLRKIYRDASALEPLVDILERLVLTDSFTGDAHRDLWLELAELRFDVLGQPIAAIEAWEEVLRLDPANERALEMLERLYSAESRWNDTARILRHKSELRHAQGQSEEATEIDMQLAELQLEKLHDSVEAANTYEAILNKNPANVDAGAKLERIYETGEKWTELSELLLTRVDHTEDSVDRVLILQNLARVYETKLNDNEAAFLVLQRAVNEDAENLHTLGELQRIAGKIGAWQDLAAVWRDVIPKMTDPMLQADYRFRLGVVVRDEVDNLDDAVIQFETVLQLQEDHEEALKALVELYTLLEQWQKLIASLRALAEVTADYQERTRLAIRIGDVYERQIGDTDAAISAYRAVLDLDEMEDQALVALERLYDARQQWPELIEILEMRGRVYPDRELSFRLRIGTIYFDKLGDAAKAIEAYESVLEVDPVNADALGALERLYGERNDFDGLVQVYERLLAGTDSDEGKKGLCEKIALVQEEIFGNKLKAADYFHEILNIDPMDENALANLERIYEEVEQWSDLVQTLERHIEVANSDQARTVLLTRMATVHRDKAMNLDDAIRTFERILDIDRTNAAALDALEQLYRENGFWEQVIFVLDRKLEAAGGETRTHLRCQKAEVYAEKMLSPEDAVAELDRALEEEPRSLVAVQALQQVHAATNDWERVVDALLKEEELHTSDELRASTLARIAEVYRERLLDVHHAVEYYERALERIPDFPEAAVPLSEIYIKQENWARAEPLLSMMVGKVQSEADPEKAAELYYLIGRSKESLGDIQAALAAYTSAYERRSRHVPTLRGLARLNLKRERYEDAERYYLELVDHIRHDATDAELADCYMALGEIAVTTNRDTKAVEYLEKVVELRPNDGEALSNLIQIARDNEMWSDLVRYQQDIVGLKTDSIEKLALQLEIGDIYKDKIGDMNGAVSAWRDALDTQPHSKAALVKLLEVFLQRRDFAEAISTLQQLLEGEDDPQTKANYSFMLAAVYRDELNDEDQAAHYLDQTLDFDPNRLEAFRALDELWTRKKAWKEEERAYRRMLERIANRGMHDLEYKLYRGLGEIYRTRLKDYEYAASAFQLAAERKPNDTAVYEILAELHEVSSESKERAIGAHRHLILLEPDKRIGSYRALFRLQRESDDLDSAWCTAGVIAALAPADDEIQRFYREYAEPKMAGARRPLDSKLWQTSLFADSGDVLIGQIFQILYETLGNELRATTLKDLDLKKKDQMSLDDGTMFANVLVKITKALGVTEPKVYVSPRQLGIRIENLNPPAIVIGSDMLKGRNEVELAFLIGKCLTYFLPIHIMAAIYTRPELKTLFVAAMKVALPKMNLPDSPEVAALAAEISRNLSAGRKEQLTELLEKASKTEVNLSQWLNNVELTGNHAGMLMCNDVGMALGALKSGIFSVAKLPVKDQAKDLVVFVVSPKYQELRQALGIQIEL